jgi:hypothetical protein
MYIFDTLYLETMYFSDKKLFWSMERGITLSNEKIYIVHTQYGCTVHYVVPLYVPIDLSIYILICIRP